MSFNNKDLILLICAAAIALPLFFHLNYAVSPNTETLLYSVEHEDADHVHQNSFLSNYPNSIYASQKSNVEYKYKKRKWIKS